MLTGTRLLAHQILDNGGSNTYCALDIEMRGRQLMAHTQLAMCKKTTQRETSVFYPKASPVEGEGCKNFIALLLFCADCALVPGWLHHLKGIECYQLKCEVSLI